MTAAPYDASPRRTIGGAGLLLLSVAAVMLWLRTWAVRHLTAWAAPVGRRGGALIVFGLGFVFYGMLLQAPRTPESAAQLGPAASILPVDAWGVVFIGSGLAAIVASRLPQGRDRIGFLPLVGLSIWWGVSGLLGAPSWGWVGALMWLLVATLALIIVGWGERAAPP